MGLERVQEPLDDDLDADEENELDEAGEVTADAANSGAAEADTMPTDEQE